MKKQRRNGFTLVELLAVIIILAVIALIATPIVLNVVENAQRKAFERSAQGYYDAARYVHNDMMLNNEEKETKFTFEDSVQKSDNPNYKLEVQGETPKSGTVHLSKDGQILVAIANDKWCATTTGNGVVDLSEDVDLCGYASEECLTYSDLVFSDSDKKRLSDYGISWEGMDGTLLQIDSFDSENPACKGIVIIPEEHAGKKVESIKMNAFKNNTNIIGVVLPKNLKVIGNYAFSMVSKLRLLIINDDLRYIGNQTFYGTNLDEITIPEKVSYLGTKAFVGAGLKKVTLLGQINIDYSKTTSPFYYTSVNGRKNAIEEVIIGSNVQKIPAYLFLYNKINKLHIPSGVTTVGAGAFGENQLTSITIPNSVTNLGFGAFAGNRLTSIEIPESITNISNSLFYDNQLTSVTIPASVVTIETGAFANNLFTNASNITILGDDPNRFDDIWTSIGFPAK